MSENNSTGFVLTIQVFNAQGRYCDKIETPCASYKACVIEMKRIKAQLADQGCSIVWSCEAA